MIFIHRPRWLLSTVTGSLVDTFLYARLQKGILCYGVLQASSISCPEHNFFPHSWISIIIYKIVTQDFHDLELRSEVKSQGHSALDEQNLVQAITSPLHGFRIITTDPRVCRDLHVHQVKSQGYSALDGHFVNCSVHPSLCYTFRICHRCLLP